MAYIRITADGKININGKILDVSDFARAAAAEVAVTYHTDMFPPTNFKLGDKWVNATTKDTATAVMVDANHTVVWVSDEEVDKNRLEGVLESMLDSIKRVADTIA